jgi:uncharacterized protein YcnI
MSIKSLKTRRAAFIAIALTIVSALTLPAIAFAHAVVFPKASTTGAYERYVLRVPNEKTTATTRVELHVPDSVRVTAFEDVPGWTLEVQIDTAKRVVGAVWTGSLPPQRFVEFPFVAANPKSATKIVWPAFQTYADGERVEWTGAEGSKAPASVTTIAVASATSSSGEGGGTSKTLTYVALALSVVALGLALRRPDSSRSA